MTLILGGEVATPGEVAQVLGVHLSDEREQPVGAEEETGTEPEQAEALVPEVVDEPDSSQPVEVTNDGIDVLRARKDAYLAHEAMADHFGIPLWD